MSQTHQKYLEYQLRTLELLKRRAEVQHRVNVEVYNREVKIYQEQIDSITKQLERTDESAAIGEGNVPIKEIES